jgi:hypothetical protein
MRDTRDEAEEIRLAAIRRQTPAERLRLMFDHSEAMRELALAGLRRRYPDHTVVQLVEMLLGQTLIPPGAGHPPR